jgi:hypothetical protein
LPEQPQLELLRPAEQQMERHQVPPAPQPTV